MSARAGAVAACAIGLLIGTPAVRAQGAGGATSIVPRPASERLLPREAPFVLESPVRIAVPFASGPLTELGEWLAETLRRSSGLRVELEDRDVARVPVGTITLALSASIAPSDSTEFESREGHALDLSSDEAYTLDVTSRGVTIRARSPAGMVWGIQSLLQLLPPTFERSEAVLDASRPDRWTIPALSIRDAPRFSWRGSLLDVSRHFLPVADVDRHIDLLSRYKLNVLHWHLTDDQGWRIEIPGLPRLTSVGAWRTEATGERTGGFYTARDIREVVEYARLRGVMIVPEIEMPGHARAMLAAYPELGCTKDALSVATTWGVFADILCPASPSLFPTMEKVLDAVVALFPAPYVHVGGDEVPKDRWRDCAECQALMPREGLADEEALQGWMLRRIGRYLASKGRTLIAWDEALDGGLDASSVVQSWRDSSRTRAAVAAGHRVIASPNEWVYLNRPPQELTLAQVNAFDPVPPGLNEAQRTQLLGSEATFWSEHITSGANLDLMALPRLLAFADRVWGAAPADLAVLSARIDGDQRARLDAAGRVVGETNAPLPSVRLQFDSVSRVPRLRLTGTLPGYSVRGSRNGAPPSAASPMVQDGASLAEFSSVRLQRFIGRETLGEPLVFRIDHHLAVGKRATISPAPDARYPGTGSFTLTDGLLGGLQHDDGLWAGWWGPDVEAVVDLGEQPREMQVVMRFLHNPRSWILVPRQVELSTSNDGVQWTSPTVAQVTAPDAPDAVLVREISERMPSARLLKVFVRNGGPLPAGHPGAGQPSWLFLDEIAVRRAVGALRP